MNEYLIDEDDMYDQSFGVNNPNGIRGDIEILQNKIHSFKNKFLFSLDNIDHLSKGV